MSAHLQRAVAVAAALTLVPLALAGCGAPAPVVEDKPTTTATSAPTIPEDKPTDPPVATGFVDIFDDSGIVTVQVPDTWTDIDGAAVTTSNGVQLASVLASPDLEGFNTSWTVPGVSIGATQDLSQPIQSYLDAVLTSVGPECDDGETDTYDDGVYVGNYLYLPNCGGVGTDFLAVAAMDQDQTQIVVLVIQMVSDEDKSTIRDQILSTFLAVF